MSHKHFTKFTSDHFLLESTQTKHIRLGWRVFITPEWAQRLEAQKAPLKLKASWIKLKNFLERRQTVCVLLKRRISTNLPHRSVPKQEASPMQTYSICSIGHLPIVDSSPQEHSRRAIFPLAVLQSRRKSATSQQKWELRRSARVARAAEAEHTERWVRIVMVLLRMRLGITLQRSLLRVRIHLRVRTRTRKDQKATKPRVKSTARAANVQERGAIAHEGDPATRLPTTKKEWKQPTLPALREVCRSSWHHKDIKSQPNVKMALHKVDFDTSLHVQYSSIPPSAWADRLGTTLGSTGATSRRTKSPSRFWWCIMGHSMGNGPQARRTFVTSPYCMRDTIHVRCS